MTRFVRFITDHPVWILAAIFAITFAFAIFLPHIGFLVDYSKMLPEDDPIVAQLQKTRDLFGGQSIFLLAIVASEGSTLFNFSSLRKLYAVTAELEKLKEEGLAEEVISAANIKIVEGTATALFVRPILPDPPQNEEDVRLFQEKVLRERMVRDRLIFADGKGALCVIRLTPDGEMREDVKAAILKRLENISTKYVGPERFYISGGAAFMAYASRYMRQDLALLLPMVVVVIATVLFLSFKNWRGVVLPLGVVLVGLVWTMGLIGITGRKLTMISTFLPMLLVAVGSAYGIHVVNDFFWRTGSGADKKALVRATLREMFLPVLGAATTTAAGFLTLLSSFLVPTREFGLFSAFGVMACFVLAMVMIPALLVLLPLPHAKHSSQERSAQKFAHFLSAYPWQTGGLVLVGLLALVVGIPQLKVETDIIRYFRENSPVREGLEVVDEYLGGTRELSVVIDTGKRDGLKSPAVLRFMDRLQRFLEAKPIVGITTSLADLVKEAHFTLRADDPAFYTIPETFRAVAQLLLLYEMGGGEITRSMATRDFRLGQVSARMRSVGLSDYAALIRAVEEFMAKEKPEAITDWYVTGWPALHIQLSEKLIASQLMSLATSFAAVGAIIAVLMLSLGAGLLSLIPLFVAVAGNFGIMGYTGAYLDMATVMIASLTVGIGVDYAVHFLSRYLNERRAGLAHGEALFETFSSCGRAIVINALTLALGFLVLLFSRFGALNTFGWLIALTMIMSMLGALLVLPAILQGIPKEVYQPWLRPEVWAKFGLARTKNPGPDSPKEKEGKR